jgi:hypothetical protein
LSRPRGRSCAPLNVHCCSLGQHSGAVAGVCCPMYAGAPGACVRPSSAAAIRPTVRTSLFAGAALTRCFCLFLQCMPAGPPGVCAHKGPGASPGSSHGPHHTLKLTPFLYCQLNACRPTRRVCLSRPGAKPRVQPWASAHTPTHTLLYCLLNVCRLTRRVCSSRPRVQPWASPSSSRRSCHS